MMVVRVFAQVKNVPYYAGKTQRYDSDAATGFDSIVQSLRPAVVPMTVSLSKLWIDHC